VKIKRIIAAVGAGALIAAGGVLAMAIPASAHTPAITGVASCQTDGTYSIDWTVTTTNVPGDETVTISNAGANPLGTFTSAIPTTLVGNTSKTVTETGIAGDTKTATVHGTFKWDDFGPVTETGTVTLAGDCTVTPPPPMKDASAAAIEVVAATCDAPGSVQLGAVANAVLAAALDQTPGDHTATFTAADGHVFSDGTTSFSEDYTVPAQLTGDVCYTPPPAQACTANNENEADYATEDVAPVDVLGGIKLTGTGAAAVDTYHAENVPLAGINGLSYTITEQSGYQAAYVLEVLTTGTNGYTTLSYEPYMNGYAAGDTGTFNADGGLWWSSHIATDQPGGQGHPITLAAFEQLYPSAVVISHGIHLGSANPSTTYSVVSETTFLCGKTVFGLVKPAQPADKVVVTPTTKTLCTPQGGGGTDTTTTVTTTTPYVYDADSNTWVLGEATSKTIMDSHAATATECPAAIVKHVTPKVATVSTVLADTGSDTTMPVWIGLGAIAAGLLAGAAALVIRRRRV